MAVMSTAFVLWLVLVGPRMLVPKPSLKTVADPVRRQELEDARLKLQNEVRTTLLQGLGGGLAVLG
jgi:hypothetical protein